MKDLLTIFKEIKTLEKIGERYALATVVKVSGSTYRGLGARMLITGTGKTIGTISGGCLEGDVLQKAQSVIAGGEPLLVEYDTTSPDDIFWGTGMGCGGVTTVLIENLSSSPKNDLLKNLYHRIQNRERFALATITRFEGEDNNLMIGTSAVYSQLKAEIDREKAAQILPSQILSGLESVYQNGKSVIKQFETEKSTIEVLLEAIMPPQPLIIFGGGHDVYPVINLANMLGWHVTVVDYREVFARKENFPAADAVFLWDDSELPPPGLSITPHTACIIMNHHYLTDKKILKQLLPSPAFYIGFLGPQKRAKQLLEEIQSEARAITPEQLSRLYSPVGLDIGAETAAEIALSIIAEIQAAINQRNGGFLRQRKGPIHQR